MNILLVEDDAGIGRFVNRGLTARGHQVAWERSGAQVKALAATRSFDAIVLDLGLPDADGLDLCRDLRAAGSTPVLMLTARDTLQDRLDGFAAGADDYLPKPFAFEELVARLQVIERRGAERAPEPLRFGDLTVDPVGRAVRCAGEPVVLGGRGIDLIVQLVRARGEVIARQALIDAIWGTEAEITDNVLDVHVGALRRKLAAAGTRLAIETVRGQGFRLTGPADADPR